MTIDVCMAISSIPVFTTRRFSNGQHDRNRLTVWFQTSIRSFGNNSVGSFMRIGFWKRDLTRLVVVALYSFLAYKSHIFSRQHDDVLHEVWCCEVDTEDAEAWVAFLPVGKWGGAPWSGVLVAYLAHDSTVVEVWRWQQRAGLALRHKVAQVQKQANRVPSSEFSRRCAVFGRLLWLKNNIW